MMSQELKETRESESWNSPSNRSNTLGGVNATLTQALYNDRDPQYQIKSEKPIHRRIAELHLQGFNRNEIAGLLSLTPAHVSNVLRQPHARAYMIEAAKRPVQEELAEFLDAELMANLKTLKEIRDSALAKPSERVAAANALLDRRLGRAVQPFANADKPASELNSAELADEVAKILNKQKN